MSVAKLSIPLVFVLFLFLGSCGTASPEEKSWNSIKDKMDSHLIDSFLKQYPNGAYAQEAKVKYDEVLWDEAKRRNTLWPILDYIEKLPQGTHQDEARQLAASLPVDSFGLEDFARQIFVGRLVISDNAAQLVSIQFTDMTMQSDTVLFKANLNSASFKKELTGKISKSDNLIRFDETAGDDLRFIKTPGRVYARGNVWFIESADTRQYWKVTNS